MEETPKYTPASYGMGFSISKGAAVEAVTIRPTWWRRIFLREKPRTLNTTDVAAKLGAASRSMQEEMASQIFRGGFVSHGQLADWTVPSTRIATGAISNPLVTDLHFPPGPLVTALRPKGD